MPTLRPAGVLNHLTWGGEAAESGQQHGQHAGALATAEPAGQWSLNPYVGRDVRKCTAKDDTCEGWRIKDEDGEPTQFCRGHTLRQAAL